MLKITALLKKMFLLALILAIGLAAVPATTVSAAGLNDQDNPPSGLPMIDALLEKVWAREQAI